MISKKKIIVIVGILCLVLLGGCGKKEETTKTVMYEFGDSVVTYGEFYIYARTIQEDYQKTYGEGVWDLELNSDDGSKSMTDITIEDIVEDINRVKVMVSKSEEMNVKLSDEEKDEAKQQAQQFYDGLTHKDIDLAELDLDTVVTVIEENMIASKVYDKVIADCDFEISDEEARMTTFYDIVFECYEEKKDGTIEEFSEEKKDLQYEKANEALSSLAQDDDVTYESIVDKYNLKYSNSYTMKKSDIVDEYGETIADKILSLSEGEVSSVIKSDYGYHIFKMINPNDEELTKKNKAEIVEQMQKDYFDDIYAKWEKKYDAHFSVETDVNGDLLKQFPFQDVK